MLLKLLSDQSIYAADKDLNKLSDIFYPVLAVIARKGAPGETVYEIDKSTGNILFEGPDKKHIIEQSKISSKTATIFKKIKEANQSSFGIEEAEQLVEVLRLAGLSASSVYKSDIYVVVHDHITGINSEVGFSIKSRVGAASTLLNASSHTNFIYRIKGYRGDPLEVNEITGRNSVRQRIAALKAGGASLEFGGLDSRTFNNNLRMIDTMLPEMIAGYLLAYYSDEGAVLTELSLATEHVPLLHPALEKINPNFLIYKIKNLLQAVALGMMPGSTWSGELEVSGGYIIVKEDGDVVCYHIYNLDQFREYLFENIKFDTPSTSRHGFGEVYTIEGQAYIKLNMQLRFVK